MSDVREAAREIAVDVAGRLADVSRVAEVARRPGNRAADDGAAPGIGGPRANRTTSGGGHSGDRATPGAGLRADRATSSAGHSADRAAGNSGVRADQARSGSGHSADRATPGAVPRADRAAGNSGARADQARSGGGHSADRATPGAVPRADPATWGGGLSAGHEGVAVLLAEIGRDRPSYVAASRAHLKAAAQIAATRPLSGGLFAGSAGLGLAASVVARSEQDCVLLIKTCTDHAAAAAVAAAEQFAGSASLPPDRAYDVISGVAGIARQLLRVRGPQDSDVRVLTRVLIGLGTAKQVDGVLLPGWASAGLINRMQADPEVERGRFNLGLAHGAPGGLAYLALAKSAGVSEDGLDDTIATTAAWLEGWYGRGHHGAGWPAYVTFAEERSGSVARSGDRGAWCYGTPGVARSLQLAARALGDADGEEFAVRAMADVLDTLLTGPRREVFDPTLCHGWAGVLRIAQVMAEEHGRGLLDEYLDELAGRVIAAYDPGVPFGFRHRNRVDGGLLDDPGLLTGAAGVAAALYAFAEGGTATGWDNAFLLT